MLNLPIPFFAVLANSIFKLSLFPAGSSALHTDAHAMNVHAHKNARFIFGSSIRSGLIYDDIDEKESLRFLRFEGLHAIVGGFACASARYF
jgi:hypothetical protein